MEKKHVFEFNTARGKMVVGTDNLEELAMQSWFMNFMGMSTPTPVAAPQPIVQQPSEELIMQRAQQMAEQMVQQQMQQQQTPSVPQPQQAPAPQQQAPAQQQAPIRQQYLDIVPDKMTKDLWEQMSPHEQEAYAQKYTQPQQQ
jgi:hypothetical protein